MAEALGAILVAFVLVLGSMIAGGIIYVVIRDAIRRTIQKD